ncbi:Domain of uncharacterised function (DUF3797) [Paenibacillus polymyxa]|uniref:DUF3797 domain-containing protein n=1 Tax=Paenibacillus polymyxa TaxID=1406 RepID=UPI000D888774|nr:DUF3797 domain-containing protein [Paenibacillus polymyxa]SPY16926.1 Domain of uncharacterised function (DUF3797) [Paenibacillus polymyxa]
MNILRTLELVNKYSKCPDCGSEHVANGAGTLIVEDDIFIRTCKCGWSVTVKDKE